MGHSRLADSPKVRAADSQGVPVPFSGWSRTESGAADAQIYSQP